MSAFLRINYFAELFGRETSTADCVECTCKRAHHFIEEAGAFGVDTDVVAALFDINAVDRFDRVGVGVFAVGGAECGIILSADQVLCCRMHRAEIERQVAAIPDVALVVGGRSAECDTVNVALTLNRKAGVEVVTHCA